MVSTLLFYPCCVASCSSVDSLLLYLNILDEGGWLGIYRKLIPTLQLLPTGQKIGTTTSKEWTHEILALFVIPPQLSLECKNTSSFLLPFLAWILCTQFLSWILSGHGFYFQDSDKIKIQIHIEYYNPRPHTRFSTVAIPLILVGHYL